MDAVELLRSKVDPLLILKHYNFDSINESGQIIRACCKIHGGDNETGFAMDSETGLWFCHTGGCGAGDVFTLVERMEHIPFPQAVKRVSQIANIDIDGLKIAERRGSYERELQNFIRVMRAQKPKQHVPFNFIDVGNKVYKYREFERETLEYFGLTFYESFHCISSKGEEYKALDRLGIPIHNEYGVTVGISLRATREWEKVKWIHQPTSLSVGNLLYNYDNTGEASRIVVCEGIFDVWAFYEIGVEAVCTYGAHLTKEQYKLLIRSGADIYLAYDGDKAGREATNKAISMLKNKANIYVVPFAEGEDPESIPREELLTRVSKAKRV